MIAETAVLSNSPWQNDLFLTKEVYTGFNSHTTQSLDTDIAALEAEIDRVKKESEQSFRHRRNVASCNTSVASSECSEEFNADLDGEPDDTLFSVVEEQDYLSTSLMNVLDSVPESFSSFEWSESELAANASQFFDLCDDTQSEPDIIPRRSNSPHTKRKRAHSIDSIEKPKSWEKLTSREQVEVIEELTKTISSKMGLREQLEVIKIINPSAEVSPTDSEFVIDLDCLSEEKLQQVREYVKQQQSQNESKNDGNNNSKNNSRNTCSSSCSSTSGSECGSPVQKKLTKKQRKTQQKEMRQRQRKEYRQMMKEKKSGLFVKEEVLALCNTEPVEEDDIDILA